MTAVRNGFDFVVSIFGVAAWSFAVFVFGSHFLSRPAGGLLAVGFAFSGLALVLSVFLQDRRMERLNAHVCPRCRAAVKYEHGHRRWDAGQSAWLAPINDWSCASCGYAHHEAWPCATCPVAS